MQVDIVNLAKRPFPSDFSGESDGVGVDTLVCMKRHMEPHRYWRIRGYDSLALIFDERVPTGQITEGALKELLRALAARHLLPQELIGAFAKRRTKISNTFLEIRKENQVEKKRIIYTCGDNPFYSAEVQICD